MSNGIELATAYVSIVPSLKGGGSTISRDLGAAGNSGGTKAAAGFRSRFSQGANAAAKDTESRFAKTAKRMATGFATVFVAKKGFDFLTGTADKYKTITGEVVKLKRYMGGTTEEASRFRFVAQQSGIDVTKMARSLGLFNKNLVAGKLDDQFTIPIRDASGQIKSFSELLPNLADQFQKMPDGPAKTARAMQLFGKSGADLIPLLNKGSAGVDELMAKADELGVTLGDKDVAAMKEANKNSRLWHASLESVQLQIGRYVLPVLTRFTGFLASKMPGVIRSVRDGAARLSLAFQPFIDKIGPGIQKVAGFFKPIVERIQAFFKNDPDARFAALATVVGGGLVAAVATLGVALWSALSPVLLIAAGIGLLVFGVIYAYRHFEGFRNVVDGVAKFLVTTVWPALKSFAAGVQTVFANAVTWVRAHWGEIQAVVAAVVGNIQTTVGGFITTFKAIWAQFGDQIVGLALVAWNQVKGTIQNSINLIRGVIEVVMSLIHGDWSGAWDGLKMIVGSVLGQVKLMVATALGTLKQVLSAAWTAIKLAAGPAWGGIKSVITGAIDAAKNYVSARVDVLVGLFNGLKGRVAGALSGLGRAVESALSAPFRAVARLWNNTMGSLHFSVPSWVPGFGGKGWGFPTIPEFHEGGTVPGRSGQEVVAKLMAGEVVLSHAQLAAIRGGAAPAPSPAAGGGGPVISFERATDPAEAAQLTSSLLAWKFSGSTVGAR